MSQQTSILCSFIFLFVLIGSACTGGEPSHDRVLLDEDFSGLDPGMFSAPVGPHTEYHYLPEAAPKGNWAVSCFTWEPGSQRAWHVKEENASHVMAQTFDNEEMEHTHPMIISGDENWGDYTVSVRFAPESDRDQSGLVFRYRNDRCYYFFGLEKGRAVLRRVRHATGFHEPDEKLLAEGELSWVPGEYHTLTVRVDGDHIRAQVGDQVMLEAVDSSFPGGKIGLMSDVPARYASVVVKTGEESSQRANIMRVEKQTEEEKLQAETPQSGAISGSGI
jgi:rhamnogalacturonan endolyase